MRKEKNIIEFEAKSEGIDLKKIFQSFWNSWPVLLLFFMIWIIFGIFILKIIPPTYQLKTSILVEEPQRMYDPYRYTLGPQDFNMPDDEYFVNEKLKIRSIPVVQQAIDSLNLNIQYFKLGLRNQELYEDSPFQIELGPEWNDEKSDLPYNTMFNLIPRENGSFTIELDGSLYKSQKKINFKKEGVFNERIDVVNSTIRISSILKGDQISGSYGFKIMSPKTVLIDYIDKINVETEELNATVMGVYLNGQSPEKLMAFLDAIGQIYIDEHLENKREIYAGVRGYINTEIGRLSDELSQKEQMLANFKEKNNVSNLSRQAGSILSRTNKLGNEEINLNTKQKYYSYLEEFINNTDNYEKLISPQAFKIKDPVLVSLTSDLVNLQMEKNHLKVEGKEQNPSYSFISSKIEAIKNSILETIEGFNASNSIRLEDIQEQIKELEVEADDIPEIERKFIKLERDYMLAETAYLNMIEKKVDSDIAFDSIMSDFSVLEPAHLLDTQPFFPNRLVIVAIVLLMTVLSMLIYMIYKLAYKNKINDISELNSISQFVPVDGIIDFSNLNEPKDLHKFDLSYTTENFNSLMLKIFERIEPEQKIISVCSLNINEGKSYICSGLANSIAQTGKTVLIIDGNFKKSTQENLLHANSGGSLKNHLADGGKLSEYISKTYHENISLLRTGDVDALISDVQNKILAEIFQKLEKQFDYILIDTAPLSVHPSGIQFLKKSGRNLIVFRRNLSAESNWNEIERILTESITSKSGLVFNGDTEKYAGLSRGAKKYYKNKSKSLIYLLKNKLSKV